MSRPVAVLRPEITWKPFAYECSCTGHLARCPAWPCPFCPEHRHGQWLHQIRYHIRKDHPDEYLAGYIRVWIEDQVFE